MNIPEDPSSVLQWCAHTVEHGLGSGIKKRGGQSNRIMSLTKQRVSPAIGAVYQAVWETQTHLTDFLASLINSASSSNDFIKETPLRQFFQEIYEQITPLWIKNPRFDFVYPETEDCNIDFLFEELRVYGGRSSHVYIHDIDNNVDTREYTKIPLVFENETVGYFSFPKEGNICLLGTEQITMMTTSIMNMIKTLILFLRAKEQASNDVLTSIANRRAVLEKADTLIRMARRNDKFTSVFMIDLDHFKTINDTHGHPIWDRVLIEVSKALSTALRPGDSLGRYGGEEFIVFANTDTEQDSAQIAERLLKVVEEVRVEVRNSTENTTIRPTCSIWIQTLPPSDKTEIGHAIIRLIDEADRALYRAKKAGRNQAVHYRSKETAPAPVWTDALHADDLAPAA